MRSRIQENKKKLNILWKENDFSNDKDEGEDGSLYQTLKFLFGVCSKNDEYQYDSPSDEDEYETCALDRPHDSLIRMFDDILSLINFGTERVYFKTMDKCWYMFVPLFLKLQAYIENHNFQKQFG